MQDLIQKITNWANDRNLINGSTPTKQGLKLMSEYGELCDSIAKNDLDGIKDGIGDVAVVAIIISTQYDNLFDHWYFERRLECVSDMLLYDQLCLAAGQELHDLIHNEQWIECVFAYLSRLASYFELTLEQCLECAYNEIKDRKGVMYKGVFIKESDPRYERVIKELSNE